MRADFVAWVLVALPFVFGGLALIDVPHVAWWVWLSGAVGAAALLFLYALCRVAAWADGEGRE